MMHPTSRLTDDEQTRYARQTILPGMGEEGQLRLKQASVFIVGCGGLGSPAAMYLAAAGIGRLGLCDFDNVEASNLQRQLLHSEQSVGTPKLESAAARLSGLRSDLDIVLHEQPFTADSIETVRGYDILLDASDNYETRDALNRVALALGIRSSVRPYHNTAGKSPSTPLTSEALAIVAPYRKSLYPAPTPHPHSSVSWEPSPALWAAWKPWKPSNSSRAQDSP